MIKAVIFDIDDTLYPYAPCDIAGMQQMREEFSRITGIEYTEERFSQLLSQAKQEVKSHTAQTASCHNRMLYAQKLCELEGCFGAENALKLYDAYWNAFLATMQLSKNVMDVFRMLQDHHIKIGFCTDLTAHIQMRKLIQLGIAEIAVNIVTSEESGAEKPSPIPYEMILKKLDVSPEYAVMVGDDYKKDVLGALKIGMQAVQFGKDCHHPVHASDFRELETILKGMIS